MPDIVIMLDAMNAPPSGDNVLISGMARCTGMEPEDMDIVWAIEVAPDTLAATINANIKTAAIDAADLRGYTIGVLDKKTLLGGAVGL